MVVGQVVILSFAILCVLVLGIMGTLSYRNSKQELLAAALRKKKEEEQLRQQQQAEDAAFDLSQVEPLVFEEEAPAAPTPPPAPRSTRNDYNFKF